MRLLLYQMSYDEWLPAATPKNQDSIFSAGLFRVINPRNPSSCGEVCLAFLVAVTNLSALSVGRYGEIISLFSHPCRTVKYLVPKAGFEPATPLRGFPMSVALYR